MSGDWEREEWRSALAAMSDAERDSVTPYYRRAPGVVGDPSDACDDFQSNEPAIPGDDE